MRKSSLSLIFIVIWLVLGMIGPAPAEPGKVSQVVYITLTKACGCTLAVCQAGDVVVENAFNGARQKLLKRIDYSTAKEAARVYLKKYSVTQAPALLFLDARGNLLWMRAGELSAAEITAQLSKFGL